MKTRQRVQRLLASLAVALTSVVAGGVAGVVSAAAAASPAVSLAATGVHVIRGTVQGLGCSTPSLCFAITQQRQGTRNAITRVVNGGASSHTDLVSKKVNAVAISCPSKKGCVVYGDTIPGNQPDLYSVSRTGKPGKAHAIHAPGGTFLKSLACHASTHDCTLAGGLAQTINLVSISGSRTTTHRLHVHGSRAAVTNAISCPSSGFCMLVGLLQGTPSAGFILPIHHGVGGKLTTVAAANSGGLAAVACPTATTCYADGQGETGDFVATIMGGKVTHTAPLPKLFLGADIACSSRQDCDIVGDQFVSDSSPDLGAVAPIHRGLPGPLQTTTATPSYRYVAGYNGGITASGLDPANDMDSIISRS